MAMHEYQKQMYKKIAVIAALVVLPVAGFFAGTQYQKQTNPSSEGRTAQLGGGPRTLRNRAIGTVKSISDTSITVTSRLDNTDKAYTLSPSTTYKNGTSDAKLSDIKTGDTVMLTLDSSDNTKATTVTLNPTTMFRGTDGSAPSTDTSGGDAVLQ
jgi:hypothetical protein